MRQYLKLVLAVTALFASGAAATAADLPVKGPRPAPVPLYNWSGCYIGGNVGGGSSRVDTTRLQFDTSPPTPAYLDYGRDSGSGFFGGGQVGCDFQTTNWVFGIESTFDFGSLKGQHNILNLPGFTESNNLQQIYTIAGRIGYLFTPQLLGYAKVGAAYFQNKNQVSFGSVPFESSKFTDPGILAGGGFEWMFAPNWSVFVEGNYIFTEDDAAHDYVLTNGVPNEVINNRQRIITGLVGVNYKFHWE